MYLFIVLILIFVSFQSNSLGKIFDHYTTPKVVSVDSSGKEEDKVGKNDFFWGLFQLGGDSFSSSPG